MKVVYPCRTKLGDIRLGLSVLLLAQELDKGISLTKSQWGGFLCSSVCIFLMEKKNQPIVGMDWC